MASVISCILGGTPTRKDVQTVGELREAMGLGSDYKATADGEPVDDSYELSDEEFVAFAPGVKGGC